MTHNGSKSLLYPNNYFLLYSSFVLYTEHEGKTFFKLKLQAETKIVTWIGFKKKKKNAEWAQTHLGI